MRCAPDVHQSCTTNNWRVSGRREARRVKSLWQAWENGTPDVGQDYIMEKAGAESARLVDLFKGHDAWGTMIKAGATKGAFRLNEPD
jgi:hypothetical protein